MVGNARLSTRCIANCGGIVKDLKGTRYDEVSDTRGQRNGRAMDLQTQYAIANWVCNGLQWSGSIYDIMRQIHIPKASAIPYRFCTVSMAMRVQRSLRSPPCWSLGVLKARH